MVARLHRFTHIVCAVALAATGCGGDDANQFREDYNAAVEELTQIDSEIGSATGGAAGESNAAISNQFDEIAETAEQTRSDLAELDPPEDAKDEFDELLSALDDGVANLRAVAKAAKSDDPGKASEAVQQLARSGQEITAAENALKKAVDN